MNTFRVQLTLRSRLGTPLAADTLWGHVAWGIRHRAGERALVDWLERYDADDPPLVLSDPMPAGCWPRPLLPPPTWPESRPSDRDADAHKRADKAAWIVAGPWAACSARVGPASITSALGEASQPPAPVPASMLHASINRLTGGTAQEGGGTLFTTHDLHYVDACARFDVWARSPEGADDVGRWLEDALSGGYGRDATTGAGQLDVESCTIAEIPAPPAPNAIVLLGHAVPRPSDPAAGLFGTEVRCGRLGGEYAIGATPDGGFVRQKRPILCLARGSVLLADQAPQYVGRVLDHVHRWPQIRHYAMTLGLPCTLDEETLREAAA